MILTDQQRMDTIQALGASHMDTPNIDRLVNEGVTFTNCHTTAPICVPARASLFSGYYPHTIGVFTNSDHWERTWVEQLRNSGYYTVNLGKMHTSPYEAEAGFDERHVVENKDRYLADHETLPTERYYFDEWDRSLAAKGYVKQQREFYRMWDDYPDRYGAHEWELPEETHPDVFVGELTTWWLDAMPKLDNPVFLEIGFPGPHPPFDPVPRWADRYRDRDLPMPDVTEADLESQPPPFHRKREFYAAVDSDSMGYPLDPDPEHVHRMRAYYYANMSMIDEQVGAILDALEANGYEDTIVLFSSDHGEGLGDHGHIQKITMYEEVTRVPTIAWSPDRFDSGIEYDGLCQLMDLGPTVLELAGCEPPESMEARSLVPALHGEDWQGRDYAFSEMTLDIEFMREEGMEGGFMTMVRSDEWKLVHFAGEDYGQLFNLVEDPGEERNLWDDPSAAEKKHELINVLCDWQIHSNTHTKNWVDELYGNF